MSKRYWVEQLVSDVWCRVDWFGDLNRAMMFCDNCEWLDGSELRIVYVETVENVLAVIGY